MPDGTYYIGFHVVSDANKGNLTVDNIKVGEPMSIHVPGEVENLTLIPGAKGALSVTIGLTAPAKNLVGWRFDRVDSRRCETWRDFGQDV